MTARRARTRRLEKEARRQYERRTPIFVQIDAGLKRIYAQAFRAMFEQQHDRLNDALYRMFYHVPWVKLPPGGLKPRRLTGKPAKF